MPKSTQYLVSNCQVADQPHNALLLQADVHSLFDDCQWSIWVCQILYNFDRFVTPLWLWHAWWKFYFVALHWRLWQGPDFIRCGPTSGYFGVALGWFGMKYTAGYATGAKTSQLPVECPNFSQNCHICRGVTILTYRQDPSMTCDNSHISACQVPHVTRDRWIDRNCTVYSIPYLLMPLQFEPGKPTQIIQFEKSGAAVLETYETAEFSPSCLSSTLAPKMTLLMEHLCVALLIPVRGVGKRAVAGLMQQCSSSQAMHTLPN